MGEEKYKKAKHTFNYELMKEFNGGKQMKDVWSGPLTKSTEKYLENIQLKSRNIC